MVSLRISINYIKSSVSFANYLFDELFFCRNGYQRLSHEYARGGVSLRPAGEACFFATDCIYLFLIRVKDRHAQTNS